MPMTTTIDLRPLRALFPSDTLPSLVRAGLREFPPASQEALMERVGDVFVPEGVGVPERLVTADPVLWMQRYLERRHKTVDVSGNMRRLVEKEKSHAGVAAWAVFLTTDSPPELSYTVDRLHEVRSARAANVRTFLAQFKTRGERRQILSGLAAIFVRRPEIMGVMWARSHSTTVSAILERLTGDVSTDDTRYLTAAARMTLGYMTGYADDPTSWLVDLPTVEHPITGRTTN